MGSVNFYHLTRSNSAQTLSKLLPKALAAGWRVEVRGTQRPLMEALDIALWQGDDFLPHGLSGGLYDADQPILLTCAADDLGLDCVMSVEGAEIAPEQANSAQRAFILFDGNDPSAVAQARVQWKSLTDAGLGAAYWAEEGAGWVKKTEKAAQ